MTVFSRPSGKKPRTNSRFILPQAGTDHFARTAFDPIPMHFTCLDPPAHQLSDDQSGASALCANGAPSRTNGDRSHFILPQAATDHFARTAFDPIPMHFTCLDPPAHQLSDDQKR